MEVSRGHILPTVIFYSLLSIRHAEKYEKSIMWQGKDCDFNSANEVSAEKATIASRWIRAIRKSPLFAKTTGMVLRTRHYHYPLMALKWEM